MPVKMSMAGLSLLLACNNPASSSAFSASSVPAEISAFDGFWSSGCVPYTGYSVLTTFNYRAGAVQDEIYAFTDASCQKALSHRRQAGQLLLDGHSTSVAGAIEVRLQMLSATYTPLTNDGIKVEGPQDCDGAPYVVGQAGNELCSQGGTKYTLLQQAENAFRFGKNDAAHDGRSAATRPVQMNPDLKYSRVSK